VATVTGMLPEAEFAFLDELFNANSAILNNLLTVLNERVYRRGAETHRLPLLSLFSASNHLPEEDALRAAVRSLPAARHVDNLGRDAVPGLLAAGWAAERLAARNQRDSRGTAGNFASSVRRGPVRRDGCLHGRGVQGCDLGVAFSDRRAVKVMKLLAASALLCGRRTAAPSDLWVLRYVWDREEQIGPLASLVNGILREHKDGPSAHRLAAVPERVDGEALSRQLDAAERGWKLGSPGWRRLARCANASPLWQPGGVGRRGRGGTCWSGRGSCCRLGWVDSVVSQLLDDINMASLPAGRCWPWHHCTHLGLEVMTHGDRLWLLAAR
jgi:MoxR-like ATPase